MKRIVVLLPAAIGVVCAAYTGIYLVRWEWNRAIIAGLFFVAAEVIVASALVLDRVRRSEQRVLAALESMAEESRSAMPAVDLDRTGVLEALRDTAPPAKDRFAWIRDRSTSMNVFLPILLGAGVVASALAWVVEHLARATISPAIERRLANRLSVLAVPSGGLLGMPTAPAIRHRLSWPRRLAVLTLVLGMGVLTAATLDYVADRTQTRPDVRDPDAQTLLDLELRGAVAAADPDRVIGHLWSVCTGPDVFRLRQLPAPVVQHGEDGLVRILVDTDIGENGLERLRGCLNDNTLDKVQARVVNVRVG